MITIEIITPRIPSSEMWKNIEITAAMSVDNESIPSKNASLPEAISACELISSPTPLTYLPNTNFTTTATAMMMSETVV